MKIYDQHVHSYYSYDSEEKLEKYLDKCTELGLEFFVTTNHLDFDFCDGGKNNEFDIEKEHAEFETLKLKYPKINFLHGIEIGYKPNYLQNIEETIGKHHFDIINFSLHESDGIDYYYKEKYAKLGPRNVLSKTLQYQLEMVNIFDDYDVFCHLDFCYKTAFLVDSSIKFSDYEDIVRKILKIIIEKDKTLELNIKVQSFLPLEHTKYLLSLYKELGGKNLTLSTDAHNVNEYMKDFDKYIEIVKLCGFDHLNYFINRKRFDYNI